MARGRFIAALAVSADDSPETDARGPLPTLEERATFYLRAVHGDRRFTSEEYSNARDLILQAMADDIAARSSDYSPDHAPLPLGAQQHDGPAAIADAPLSRAATQPPARGSEEAASVVARKLSIFSQRLPLRLPSFPALPRMAAVCAAATVAAVAGYWVGGLTARFANTPHDFALTAQVTPPGPSSGSPSNPRIVAEAERELASALNSAQLRPDEIIALVSSGQELVAEGKFRFARLVLERAAEAKSAAAALALARTYDPLVDRPAGRGDAPPDIAMARAWYEKARDLGSPEAAQRLSSVPAAPTRPSPK